MRLVRSLALAVVILALYFAQYILDYRSLGEFFPHWFLDLFPSFYRFARWLPDDLLDLALWLTVLGGLSFGLLAPLWRDNSSIDSSKSLAANGARTTIGPGRFFWWGVGASLLLAGYGSWMILVAPQRLWVPIAWAAAIGVYVVAGFIVTRSERPPEGAVLDAPQPYAGWPFLLVILGGTGLLYLYAPADIPLRTDALTARLGLGALSLVQSGAAEFSTVLSPGFPRYALYPSAAGAMITGDGLLGVRLAGGYAGLLSILATWLIGCELFRRTPLMGQFGETIEDDGRWMALLATLIVAFGVPLMHFGRIPVLLESVAWGTLGLWALLRGMRLNHYPTLGVSGLLLGLATIFGSGGLLFVWLSLVWWCGVWLLQRSWIVADNNTLPTLTENGGQQHRQGSGWSGLLYWATALMVVMLPFAATLLSEGTSFSVYLQTAWGRSGMATAPAQDVIDTLWPRLRVVLLSLTVLPDQSALFGFDGHLINSLLAPIFILSIGCLLLNLDTVVGWVLLTWLGGGILLISLFELEAPAWPALLLLWPAVALTIAYGFDRIRVAWMTSAGTWMVQATVYLAIGLVIGAGMLNWIDYYEHVQLDGDVASYVGRALRTLDPDEVALVVPDDSKGMMDDPVVDFLANGAVGAGRIVAVKGEELLNVDGPISRIVLMPHQVDLQGEVESNYPSARLTIERNLHGDPMILIYELIDNGE